MMRRIAHSRAFTLALLSIILLTTSVLAIEAQTRPRTVSAKNPVTTVTNGRRAGDTRPRRVYPVSKTQEQSKPLNTQIDEASEFLNRLNRLIEKYTRTSKQVREL